MAKKKETFEPIEIKTPKLTPDQYWEWRNTCTELFLANNKAKLAEVEAQVLKRDVEIANVRVALHQATKVKTANEEALHASESYRKIKDVLEDHLGVSLNGKLIDDITYEVKDGPK